MFWRSNELQILTFRATLLTEYQMYQLEAFTAVFPFSNAPIGELKSLGTAFVFRFASLPSRPRFDQPARPARPARVLLNKDSQKMLLNERSFEESPLPEACAQTFKL